MVASKRSACYPIDAAGAARHWLCVAGQNHVGNLRAAVGGHKLSIVLDLPGLLRELFVSYDIAEPS